MSDGAIPYWTSIEELTTWMDQQPMMAKVGGDAVELGLEKMKVMVAELGHPEEGIPMIHVAGTNGKGTVCRLAAELAMAEGLKVGVYTSPHMLRVQERWTLNGVPISDELLLRLAQEAHPVVEAIRPTFFELTTLIAFLAFASWDVDVAIVETGLGGRLDATNVITPRCSVITSISYDHTDILGHTIEEIATEKAGIIKANTPIVLGNLPNDAKNCIMMIAQEKDSEVIDGQFAPMVELELATRWDRQNLHLAGLACARIGVFAGQHPTEKRTYNQRLEEAWRQYQSRQWMGRPFISINSNKTWYYDGAHNEEAIALCLQRCQMIAPLSDWTVVYAPMKDKVSASIVDQFDEFGECFFVSMNHPRAATTANLPNNNAFTSISVDTMPEVLTPMKDSLVIFTGSFYFYETLYAGFSKSSLLSIPAK
jgi:dihydrofolate synthase/folylpolyglutamate synthase